MRKWKVRLYIVEQFTERRRFFKGGKFWADSAVEAAENALDCWWDPRFEIEGFTHEAEVEPMDVASRQLALRMED
jgi:hypothetical protein